MAGEKYGQHHDLIGRIKSILEGYGTNIAVITEFLQNADDAGATEFIVMLDTKSYSHGSLFSKDMEQFQGPSLLFYNNATFREQDFEALAKIGSGHKRDDHNVRIGRYGCGFNVAYAVTDVPSFVTGEYAVWFDPATKYVPGVDAADPGIRFKTAAISKRFPDQFEPFIGKFGFTLSEKYQHIRA